MSEVLELYGKARDEGTDWTEVFRREKCPFLDRKCTKTRKSTPEITIGTCTVLYGREARPIVICPNRLLERNQVFIDCLHLLTLHEPGNELHIVPEITIPGGSVDYFLLSVKKNKVRDFVGIELQSLDTTGTVWPARQSFLTDKGIMAETDHAPKSFGMNWKMTAKTTLVQLNHKIQTFENAGKHLVLVIQNVFFEYMRREFQFDHIGNARLGDTMHIHTYNLNKIESGSMHLELDSRYGTDANGIALSLGLQVDPNLALEEMIRILEAKISPNTLFTLR